MRKAFKLYGNSVGKKITMGITGVLMVGFLIGHMAGNLKAFFGAEAFNEYAEFLREFGHPLIPHGGFLWTARVGLLVIVALHIWSAAVLVRQARAARPVNYQKSVHIENSYASRTMRWGGVIILLFIVYHILHMTTGTVHGDFVRHDAYHNLVSGFSVAPVALFYILTMVILGFHLYHGIWSFFQTMGLNNERYKQLRRGIAGGLTAVIIGGFLTVPISVLVGILA